MASPPAGSPPGGLNLPKRPPLAPLALPRKSSLASTPSAHPLRQTSFPPPDSLEAQHQAAEDTALRQFSPSDDGALDDFSDSEITSAISGPVADEALSKKRKRGEKKTKGRQGKGAHSVGGLRAGSASLVNGDDGKSSKRGGTAGAPSVVTGDGAEGNDEEEDDEDEDEAAGGAGDKDGFNATDLEQDNRNRYLFREAIGRSHQDRYDAYNKVKLRTADVRRLVNATLSQSVPQNVVTVVGSYTKMFAGMLIESAREVQSEWMASAETRPDGEENRAFKRLRMMQPEEEIEEEDDDEEDEPEAEVEKDKQTNGEKETTTSKDEPSPVDAKPSKSDGLPDGDYDPNEDNVPGDTQPTSSPNGQPNGEAKKPADTQTNGETEAKKSEDTLNDFEHAQPGAWGLSNYLKDCDRGPLLPDHLREALRRYRKSRDGGSVGFTGISLERSEVAAPRMGGKRLFK